MENPLSINIQTDIDNILKVTNTNCPFPKLNLNYSNELKICLMTKIDYCLDIFNRFVKKVIEKLDNEQTTLEELQQTNFTFDNPNNQKRELFNMIFPEFIKLIVENYTNEKSIIKPNNHQAKVLNKIILFYEENTIGKLLWSCGLGKTLLSILICKKMNYSTVLVAVPSVFLQKQFINEILKIYPVRHNILCVGGDEINSTTKQSTIINFLNKKLSDTKFIISTYTSCNLLVKDNIVFDFKIGDESHHLTGLYDEETIGYLNFHKIKSTKTLFMTATEKVVETKTNKTIYSMNDEKVFGKLIDEKTVHWAIENKKITDYYLLLISNSEKEINEIIIKLGIHVDNRELFMSAFVSLKSIEKYSDLTHILICCNTTENSEIINSYIELILEKNILNIKKHDLYHNALHSNKVINLNLKDPNNEIEKFKSSKYGIISSVYIFGEGFDLPKLNGVMFSENMQSDIRIVQTALRPNRLEKSNPNKKSYIIIPYMEVENKIKDGIGFNKVRMIIRKLRNVDETIEQKMICSSIKKYEKNDLYEDGKNDDIDYNIKDDEINELNKIKLKLKHSKILNSLNPNLDEYNYVKLLNKQLKIQSKEEYVTYKIKLKHDNYIDKADEYFKSKAVWNNWYDFLGLDTTQFIKTKHEWKIFCHNKNINSLNDYDNACAKYKCLPKSPVDFYEKEEFTNIPLELGFSIKRR